MFEKFKKRFALCIATKWLRVSSITIEYKDRNDKILTGNALISRDGLPVWNALMTDSSQWVEIKLNKGEFH